MPLSSKSIEIGIDQQIGAVQAKAPQADCVRAETIRSRDGMELTLIVVADGEGQAAPERAASLAVQTVFSHCQRASGRDPHSILWQAAEAANTAINESIAGGTAALTAVAIHAGRLYSVQVGEQTRAYLVREGKVQQVARGGSTLLGQTPDSPIAEVTAQGVDVVAQGRHLRSGDQIVVCSDGLFGPLSRKDIGVIGRYSKALEAARHLSSLAMGRNVNDNVSVVVAQFGRKPVLRSGVVVAIGTVAVLASAIVAGIVLLQQPSSPTPVDLGWAVLVSGEAVQAIGPDDNSPGFLEAMGLETIAPGLALRNSDPDKPARIQLKTRQQVESEGVIDLPVEVILGPETEAELAVVDLEDNGNPDYSTPDVATDCAESDVTRFTLRTGKLLFVSRRGDENEVRRCFMVQAESATAVLRPPSSGGALGVSVDTALKKAEVHCLRGTCLVNSRMGGQLVSQPVPESAKLVISLSTTPASPMLPTGMTTTDREYWKRICDEAGVRSSLCDFGPG